MYRATSLGAVCAVMMAATLSACGRDIAPAAADTVVTSQLAGSWYDADSAQLQEELHGWLGAAAPAVTDRVCALIVPHAGYRFSGRVAAEGYRQVADHPFKRVILLGPSHRVSMRDIVSVPEAAAYRTPLGTIAVDTACVAALRASPFVRSVAAAHEGEHSVEIQFPFLQTVLPGVPVVPVVVGQLDLAAARGVAAAVRAMVDDDTLVVVSSDFTHFGPNYGYVPFASNRLENISRLDMSAYAYIERKDAAGFADFCQRTGDTICGRDPITVLLALLPADARVQALKYDTSGRMMHDDENSVSYLSVVVTGAWTAAPRAPGTTGPTLGEGEKRDLLCLARGALAHFYAHGDRVKPEELGIEVTPAMRENRGAFVTLKEDGDLRGCIGEIVPRRALYEVVIDHAIDAAVHDPRFVPVAASELTNVVIEVSALTPPHAVASYQDIVLGRDGMVLNKGAAHAVFLPQVAPEQHWDLSTTLSHLSLKAGLPPTAWQEGAQFDVFQAEVFGEDER